MSIEYKFLSESDITEEQYYAFLKKAYGNKARHKFEERFPWFKQNKNYRILLALSGGDIIGQACAYEVEVIANGKEIPLTWGVDNVVLPEARGKGVGKTLQKILHESSPNFSSVWYSHTNGHIKRKCGAKCFIPNRFPYYAVSKFFGIYVEIAYNLLFKRNIRLSSGIPFLYYKLFNINKRKDLILTEVSEFSPEHIRFIQESLEMNYDFYVKRDKEYLEWKYYDNPTIKGYHIIEVKRKNEIVAIVSFTNVQERSFVRTNYSGATILDVFIKDEQAFSRKNAFQVVADYYKKKGIVLDGISTIFDIPNLARINYPRKGMPFLSTYKGNINKPYLSFMDQDMEQI